ncbi:hypothetical protein XENOCAPTIV_000926 [Xenoophorus captivus]|uniref:Uncharacterized protein n=1 Tax=Xenoophorus captivus TaxID=1517983 RepID=A0ABV0RJW9_9TELE
MPSQGLQSKGMSKGKRPGLRAEGSIKESADWIKNKVKAQIDVEERLKANWFLETGSEGLNAKRRPEEIKRILTQRERLMCVPKVQRESDREREREVLVCVLRATETESVCGQSRLTIGAWGGGGR